MPTFQGRFRQISRKMSNSVLKILLRIHFIAMNTIKTKLRVAFGIRLLTGYLVHNKIPTKQKRDKENFALI